MPKKKVIKWHLYVIPVEERFIEMLFDKSKEIMLGGEKQNRVGIPRDKKEDIDFSSWAANPTEAEQFKSIYERLLDAGLLQVVTDEAPNGKIPHRLVDTDRWLLLMIKKRPIRYTKPGVIKLIRFFQRRAMKQIIHSVQKYAEDRNSEKRYGIKPASFNRTITGMASTAGSIGIYPLAREVKKGKVWIVVPTFEQCQITPNKTNGKKKTAKSAKNGIVDGKKHEPKKPRRKKSAALPATSPSEQNPSDKVVGNETEKRYYALCENIEKLQGEIGIKQLEIQQMTADLKNWEQEAAELSSQLKDAWRTEREELKKRLALVEARIKQG